MLGAVDRLYAEALKLPEQSRLELAERLMSTLNSDSFEAEHLCIIFRRVQEARANGIAWVSQEEAFRHVQQSLEARRGA